MPDSEKPTLRDILLFVLIAFAVIGVITVAQVIGSFFVGTMNTGPPTSSSVITNENVTSTITQPIIAQNSSTNATYSVITCYTNNFASVYSAGLNGSISLPIVCEESYQTTTINTTVILVGCLNPDSNC